MKMNLEHVDTPDRKKTTKNYKVISKSLEIQLEENLTDQT